MSKRVAMVSVEGLGVILTGAAIGADLGGSSKHSREFSWKSVVEEVSM